jgi:hypothetical protein
MRRGKGLNMKETIAHILEVVVVVIALFAVIAIITVMTDPGEVVNGELTGGGIITQKIDQTIKSVFEKTDEAISGTSSTGDTDNAENADGTNTGSNLTELMREYEAVS